MPDVRKLDPGIMTSFAVKLNQTELRLLTDLAADQLFRREFIDSRLPGFRFDTVELKLGKELVERLRSIADHNYSARVRLRKSNGATG
jgi:hypothetical protein